MRRARHVEDTGLIPFVDTEAAARYLALSPHPLECYRSLGGGPPFYKFGKFVRYAVSDLEAWAGKRRQERTTGENARVCCRAQAVQPAATSCSRISRRFVLISPCSRTINYFLKPTESEREAPFFAAAEAFAPLDCATAFPTSLAIADLQT